jgi:hypothetical protein
MKNENIISIFFYECMENKLFYHKLTKLNENIHFNLMYFCFQSKINFFEFF